jgi:hypothetical protein
MKLKRRVAILPLSIFLLNAAVTSMAQSTVPGELRFNVSTIASGAGYPGASIASGDFNNDGIPDLLTTGYAGILCCASLALGRGDGTFHAFMSVVPAVSEPYIPAVGDVNLDGNLDFVALGFYNLNVHVALGDGSGEFSPGTVAYVSSGVSNDVIIADVNGDGKPDIVGTSVGSKGEYLWLALGNGDGTFQKMKTFSVPGSNPYPIGVALGDFNGDGKIDAVVNGYDTTSNLGTIELLLGNGDGTFQTARSFDLGSGYTISPVVGDFNNDGKLDVAVLSTMDNVTVLLGNGDGTFGPPNVYAAGITVSSLAVADLDGDGTLDLAVAHWGPEYGLHGSFVSILTGKGDGTFNAPVKFAVDSQPVQLIVADFNGDGKPDIATANQMRGTSSILINQTAWPHRRPGRP